MREHRAKDRKAAARPAIHKIHEPVVLLHLHPQMIHLSILIIVDEHSRVAADQDHPRNAQGRFQEYPHRGLGTAAGDSEQDLRRDYEIRRAGPQGDGSV